jgi:uncharacterized protein YggL (DUF469 family)
VKRRLRKKKRLLEFQELGFEVTFRSMEEVSAEQRLDLLWEFLEHAIEANGLVAGGGGGNPSNLFVVSAEHRKSATEHQRLAVEGWLATTSQVTEFTVAPLRDAWHGWDE